MLYEDCSLKLVTVLKVLLDTLFKSPALYILRSETSALVTINYVWNSGGDK